ncbi:MAG: hypothetical protein ACKVOU_09950 [Cytophagales bacterium]
MLKKETKNIDIKYQNPLEYRVGVEIGDGTVVSKIFYKNANYVIFGLRKANGIESDNIEYLTINDDKFNTHAISVALNRVNYYLEDSSANCDNYNETIADAISLCFRNNEEEAILVMAQLENEVKNEVYKWSKLIYLAAYLLFTLSIALLTWLIQHNYTSNKTLFYMISLGAIGGLLSVANSIDKYNVEIKNHKKLISTIFGPYLVGVMVRLTVACVGAATAYIVLKSKVIVIPGITDIDNPYFMYAIGLVSGFSQNFVPSLLTKFETNVLSGEPVQVKPSGETTQKTISSTIMVPSKNNQTQSETVVIEDDAVG